MLFGNPFEAMKKKNETKRRLAAFNLETKCETQHSLVAVRRLSALIVQCGTYFFYVNTRAN